MIEAIKFALYGVKISYRDTRLLSRKRWQIFSVFVLIGTSLLLAYLLSREKSGNLLELLTEIPWGACLVWLLFSVLFMLGCCVAYEKLLPDSYLKLQHRQRLAEMIVKNKWYETAAKKKRSDLSELFQSDQEEVLRFPKMYYRLKDGEIGLAVEVLPGNYQEPLLNLEKQIEPLLFCELVSKELKKFYVEYHFAVSLMSDRIQIGDVVVRDGKIRLMKNLWWEYDKLPHALIIGGTGGGKTYFILTLIEALLKSGAEVSILDPKRSDLADLAECMPNVYYEQEDMTAELNRFYDGMMERTLSMKEHPRYKTGENYAYLGLEPHFLIFDEYVAFMEMVGRDREKILSLMRKIVMLGRQVGYFLILACQRPDAKYFGDGMRDQFHLRVALGKNSEMGYAMVFGSETNKQFFEKAIKGRGYADVGTGTIREFYTPYVDPGYDFLTHIRDLGLMDPDEPPLEEKESYRDCYEPDWK